MPITRGTKQPAESDPEAESGCSFVLREGEGTTGAIFCEAPRRPGSSYCPRHHALCHLPCDSIAERECLREIEALAGAVGGKTGRDARHPPPRLLRRLARIARKFSSPNCSCIVPVKTDGNAARR